MVGGRTPAQVLDQGWSQGGAGHPGMQAPAVYQQHAAASFLDGVLEEDVDLVGGNVCG
jgi:hypothetical protein